MVVLYSCVQSRTTIFLENSGLITLNIKNIKKTIPKIIKKLFVFICSQDFSLNKADLSSDVYTYGLLTVFCSLSYSCICNSKLSFSSGGCGKVELPL